MPSRIDLKQLRQQRNDKAKAGRDKVAELNRLLEKADCTDEEKNRITALETEIDALTAEVETLDAAIAAEDKKIRRAQLLGGSALAPPSARVPGQSTRVEVIRAEPNPETTGGFHSLAEFAIAVANVRVNPDQRLFAAPSGFMQNEGAGAEGFLVPVQFRQEIWEIAFSPDDFLGMISTEPTTSNAVALAKDETTPWGAVGVQANWRSEASQLSASKLAPTGAMVPLHELYAFVIATNELLEDAPRLNDRLTNKAGLAIRWKAGDAMMWGDGNGKPLGFMKAGCLITVNKDSGQASKTLSVGNILNMSSRLLRYGGSGRGAIWIGNSDIIPQLGQLTIGNVPAWLPLNSPIQGPFEGTLGGRSFLPTEHNDTLGNLGDLALVDWSGYYGITKAGGGIDYAASIHLFFDYGMQAFRWTFRFGGQPFLSAPVSPARGITTKSHFVTLQAR